jgi:hypothetical protein
MIHLVSLFLFSPSAPATQDDKEEEWSDVPSDVVHLKERMFDEFLENNPSVLVMFYAPCKLYLQHDCTTILSFGPIFFLFWEF